MPPEPVPLSECIADLRDFLLERWENEQEKRPLGGASTPLVQGASPTSKESTE